VPGGYVELSVRLLGTGPAEPETIAGTAKVSCGSPGVVELPFTKPPGGMIEVYVEPDNSTIGQAAMAYRIDRG
jgi:hypothetical protein